MHHWSAPSRFADVMNKALALGIDGIAKLLAYLAGASFLLVALYITYDALARHFGLAYSGVNDEISAYVLGVAGTWGMAYALQVSAHVRIDLVIAHVGPRARHMFDILAGGTTLAFAGLLAYYGWAQAAEAYEIGTRSITVLRAPLAVVQALIAVGYTLLAIQAASLLARGVALGVGGDRL